MSQELIVTLEAKEGKNPGEAIASYGKQIVFLPHGIAAGQSVRVKLVEIGKNDSRGRAMYRGVPAGLEYSESWKDNGDGTASRITIATDWLGKTSEVGVVEARPLQKRELYPTTQSSFQVIWGADLASSVVEDSPIRLYTLEEEKVGCGQLVWQRYGERKEPQQPINCSIKGIETSSSCDWYQNRLQAVYHTQSDVRLAVEFYLPGTDGSSTRIHRLSTPWIIMPKWWQAEQEARYPLCACGRHRYDSHNLDGYAKCEKCREEEICIRCEKKSTVKNFGGRLVCNDCQPYEEQEQLIAKLLSAADKERIAAEAKKLLTGQVFSQLEGEVILKATLNHIATDWRKTNIIQKIVGKNFYYFCGDGVYGSKFSPAALQILQFIPLAAGNPLVEMVSWLTSPDFFLRTQVNGESGVSLPQITADQLKQLKVAEFLRGSEADRIAVLEGYRNLVVKLGKESDEAKAVAEILEHDKQDYAAALAKIREADEQMAAAARGEIIVNFSGHFRHMGADNQSDVWVIAPSGGEVEPEINYRKRYTEEGDKSWKIVVGKNDLALRWSRWQEGCQYHESWEVVKLPLEGMTTEQRDGARRVEPHERFSGPGSGFDLSRVGTNKCSVSRELGYDHFWVPSHGSEPVPCDDNREPLNPEALLAKQLQEAKVNYESNLAYAKEQVANGSWIRIKFRKGTHPHTGNVQWEAGNKHCKYVLDRFTVYEPVEAEAYYCSFGKVLVETSTTRVQLVNLERPFPEDAPEPAPQAESANQSGSTKLTSEMITALKAKWSN